MQGLNRNWGRFSLKNINLCLGEKEYFVLLGPCGAGKTLLLETICGLWKADKGKISVNGKDITHFPPEGRRFGLIYQEPSLFPHLTIEENIFYGIKVKKIKIDREKEEVIEFIKQILNLEELIKLNNPNILSGGQKQIVSVARALFSFPEVLLLDEPFHSLDYKLQSYLTKILKEINQRLKLTVIHVTHNLEEAEVFSSKTGFISGGELLKIGSFPEVKIFLKNFYGI